MWAWCPCQNCLISGSNWRGSFLETGSDNAYDSVCDYYAMNTQTNLSTSTSWQLWTIYTYINNLSFLILEQGHETYMTKTPMPSESESIMVLQKILK